MEKLKGRYRDFSLFLCPPHVYPLPLSTYPNKWCSSYNLWNYIDTYDSSTLLVQIRSLSWSCTFCGFWKNKQWHEICEYGIIENVFTALKYCVFHLFIPPPHPTLITTNDFYFLHSFVFSTSYSWNYRMHDLSGLSFFHWPASV
jgi:hypothetical protein